MQFFNHLFTYFFSIERAEEMAKLGKHSPDMLGDIASNHHRHYPLNPYMVVMTLQAGHFAR